MFNTSNNIVISNIEKELCELNNFEINYTYDTLEQLQKQFPKSKLYFTIDSDLLQKIDIWYKRDIYLTYYIIVICRDTYPICSTTIK
jgi:nicotinic acid mononucleotide adenylyltransferase